MSGFPEKATRAASNSTPSPALSGDHTEDKMTGKGGECRARRGGGEGGEGREHLGKACRKAVAATQANAPSRGIPVQFLSLTPSGARSGLTRPHTRRTCACAQTCTDRLQLLWADAARAAVGGLRCAAALEAVAASNKTGRLWESAVRFAAAGRARHRALGWRMLLGAFFDREGGVGIVARGEKG
eukprot:364325-Chlamydomonas_euryale.AAC.15